MLNVAVCDDQKLFCENIVNIIKSNFPNRFNVIDIFDDGMSLINYIISNKANTSDDIIYNIIILDVSMPKLNGIDTASRLRTFAEYKECSIIFITGYECGNLYHMVKVHPHSYITKDSGEFEKRLAESINSACELYDEHSKYLIINYNKNCIRLRINDILYIESYLHYIIIYTSTESTKANISLKLFLTKLAEQNTSFVRIHRSYVINLNHVKRYSYKYVILSNETRLNIGSTYYHKTREAYLTHFQL